jgi:hypothetical protein
VVILIDNVDDVHPVLLLVRLHSVVGEISLVSIFDGEPFLFFVGQELANPFQSGCLEHLGQKKFVSPERKAEIGKSGSVVPLVPNLTLVDAGDELCHGDGVFSFFSPEIWDLDYLLLERDIGVGQNLFSQLCGRGLCHLIDDYILVLGNHIAACSGATCSPPFCSVVDCIFFVAK